MKRYWIIALAALLGSSASSAQTGDRDKPIEIIANRFHGDEVGQKATYIGNVEVHQGTLEILGDRLDIEVDAKNYRTITIIGRPVLMKERQDPKTPGIDEWVHASALKAVYREKEDVIILTTKATLDRRENGIVMDSAAGAVITYDLLHATSRIEGEQVGKMKSRVSTILAPRKKGKSAQHPVAPTSASMRSSRSLQ